MVTVRNWKLMLDNNEKVTIQKGGETKTMKWKKAQPLVESEGWSLEE